MPSPKETSVQPFMKVASQTPATDDRDQSQHNVFRVIFKHREHSFEPSPSVLLARSDSPPASAIDRHQVRFAKPTFKAAYAEKLLNPAKKRKINPEEPRPAKPRKVKTGLRKDRPVQNAEEIYRDIWRNILCYCEPRLLLHAKTINSMFHDLLSEQTIWRTSRECHFPDSPECPDGLSEELYVDLLVGKGCQDRACARKETANVSWAFKVRLCMDCLHKRTISVQELPADRKHVMQSGSEQMPLWDALPMIVTRGVRYGEMRSPIVEESRWRWHGGILRCLKAEYDKLEAEWENRRHQNMSDEELTEWWASLRDETMVQMDALGEVEAWRRQQNEDMFVASSQRRRTKEDFFIEQASQLDPPIKENALKCMVAYHKAMKSSNAPSKRAWEVLKTKILPLRDQAMMLAENLQHSPAFMFSQADTEQKRMYQQLRDHRDRLSTASEKTLPITSVKTLKPEEQFVVDLAQKQFAQCVKENVVDDDLVLTCLKKTWDAYDKVSSRPSGLNFDGTIGPYKLSMDDTRMILQEVFYKEIPYKSTRGVLVYKSFICSGCTRKDYVKRYNFEDCMDHILCVHARLIGEGMEYYHFAVTYSAVVGPMSPLGRYSNGFNWYRFPWLAVAWPRNLPVLPLHVDPANVPSWDPDADVDYSRRGLRADDMVLFNNRQALTTNADFGFIENFDNAVRALKEVRLSNASVVRIAMQYALDLNSERDEPAPSLGDFLGAIPAFQATNPALHFKFRCGKCLEGGAEAASARYVKHEVPMSYLRRHWDKKHKPQNLDWTEYLMHLPSDEELTKTLLDSDAQLQKQKDEIMVKVKSIRHPRKKPNPKATTILTTRTAMSAFDQLYSKPGHSTEPKDAGDGASQEEHVVFDVHPGDPVIQASTDRQ